MKIEDVKFKAKIKGRNKLVSVTGIDLLWPKTGRILTHDERQTIHECRKSINFKDVEELLPFTGFKDKKGKEIYEYDLINVESDLYMVKYWNGEFLLVDVFPSLIKDDKCVFNENNTFERHLKIILENQYKSPHTDFRGFIPWVYDDKMTFEVVGNRFENSELLENKN